ncbi:unnamed protein product, partial [Brachionus calyciflorus]
MLILICIKRDNGNGYSNRYDKINGRRSRSNLRKRNVSGSFQKSNNPKKTNVAYQNAQDH